MNIWCRTTDHEVDNKCIIDSEEKFSRIEWSLSSRKLVREEVRIGKEDSWNELSLPRN